MIVATGGSMDGGSERERDVARKRAQRNAIKTIIVPPCRDRVRRAGFESCDEEWLRYYCAELFWYDFTAQQLAMIAAIRHAILYGGDQALAASRGEGKTKLFERMLMKYTLQGVINFSVLFAATATAAQDSLQSMRDEIEHNDRLFEDYPEVAVPVRALEDTPNRAHYQLVTGKRHDNDEPYEAVSSRFTWCGHEIILPNVPGSPSAWGVIATRGLDSAARGLNKKNRRPQLVGIDDPDTEETVSNPIQAQKLEKRIDRNIAGLGGQQRGVARVMLTTLQKQECVSAWFTDPARKPSWKGQRFRFLVKPPDRMDLWEQYMAMRQANLQARDADGRFVDENARGAHQFYLDARETMDAGADVANPHRFNGQELPDGTQLEVSALQRYFNEVARIGQEAVSAEYDNDPAAEESAEVSSITSAMVASRVNGLEHQELPADRRCLVTFLDLGHNYCYGVDGTWNDECVGYVTDYGALDVHGVGRETDQETLERALTHVLHEWRTQLLARYRHDGQSVPIDLALIDSGSGLHTKVVYRFCREVGPPFFPSKGFARGLDRWKPPHGSVANGDHWSLVPQKEHGHIRLFEFNSDYWKQFAHQRFLTPTFDENNRLRPGSLSLFVCPDAEQFRKVRREYSHQVVAEIWGAKKPGAKPGWMGTGKNHYLDATAGICLAGNIKGVRLVGDVTAAKRRRPPSERPTPAQLAAGGRP